MQSVHYMAQTTGVMRAVQLQVSCTALHILPDSQAHNSHKKREQVTGDACDDDEMILQQMHESCA